MLQYYLSGILLRSSQIVVDAAIWIAFGCFIAGIFRNMLGPDKTRSLFGDNSRFGLIIGWGIGMLLPVCSLGVIPVLAELHRARVKPGTIVAFGLTAPLFNPISVLYGLSLSDPFAILIFAAAAVLIVTVMGAVWGRFVSLEDAPATEATADRVPATGTKRSLGVLYSASSYLVGWPLLYLVIGILVSATVASCFASGALQTATEPDDIWAPAFMAAFITPVYSTPLLAMSQIGGMFQHGNSVGAAFSLLILGTGVNFGVLIWFATAFGVKRFLIFVGMLFAITVALAYGMDKPLYPKGVEPAGHTHAFDIYTHPYHPNDGLLGQAVTDAREYQLKHGWVGPYVLLGLMAIGLGFAVVRTRWDLLEWLYRPEPPTDRTKWDPALPGWVIGMVACIGLIAASVFGTFIYYPEAEVLLNDLSGVNNTCVSAANSGDLKSLNERSPTARIFRAAWKLVFISGQAR